MEWKEMMKTKVNLRMCDLGSMREADDKEGNFWDGSDDDSS